MIEPWVTLCVTDPRKRNRPGFKRLIYRYGSAHGIAVEITERIKARDLSLPPIHYRDRVDKSSGKLRRLGKVLAAYNGISNPNIIRVGQKIKIPGTSVATSKKSNTEVAREVIQGKWGNGATRKQKLTAAGYDYSTVQAEVNRLLK